MKQTISVLVENQAGVLNRITSLFSRRAFNIDSLAVGVTDDPAVSRITIIVESGNSVVEQVEKQLNKLVEVIKVRTLDDGSFIGRELMILKVSANSKTRPGIVDLAKHEIMDTSEVYSGCYCRFSINFYPFSTSGNNGVAAGLNNIQKMADGVPLGGRSRAEDDFDDDYEGDEDFGDLD